ncbi:MAG: hypothetical protein FWG44_03150 [Oscillospiraceae bacterium]|nr:hypothetical protein [Oscillospiraceae bacterium]
MNILKIISQKGELVLSDVNVSSIKPAEADESEWMPFALSGFDPNSQATTQDAVSVIDMDGQHTISSRLNQKPLVFTVSFSGEYMENGVIIGGGVAKMHEYRRAIIKYIPLNEIIECEYNNGNDVYYINARLTEIPVFNTVGSLSSATFTLIADYPFWHQTFTIENMQLSGIASINYFDIETKGDLISPVNLQITGITEPEAGWEGTFIAITSTIGRYAEDIESTGLQITRRIKAGEKLIINSGFNNQYFVNRVDVSGKVSLAMNYVKHSRNTLLHNYPGVTRWAFLTLGGGVYSANITCENLYSGV